MRSLRESGERADWSAAATLALWSGWGALPHIVDQLATSRRSEELRTLLTPAELRAAGRSTINAHYTTPWIAEQMWTLGDRVLGRLAHDVLEPGCGSGIFMAAAPHERRTGMVGVEKDPVSAEIASRLIDEATIIGGSIEDLEPGGYELVIGNVPFADVNIYDPGLGERRLGLHNYAIAKSLSVSAPGALAVLVTSSYTLDAKNDAQRREIARFGEFIGAVRLNHSTFEEFSGTSVVADIVVLRRRDRVLERGEVDGRDELWFGTSPVPLRPEGRDWVQNNWFARHPELVLGDYVASTMYGGRGKSVDGPAGELLRPRLQAAMEELGSRASVAMATAKNSGRVAAAPSVVEPQGPSVGALDASEVDLPSWAKQGSIFFVGGEPMRLLGDELTPFLEAKGTGSRRKLAAGLAVRDALNELVQAEAAGRSDDDCDALRVVLNERYDECVTALGRPLSYYSMSAPNPRTGRSRRLPESVGRMRGNDPDYAALVALEDFDRETGLATRAPIFSRRVLRPKPPAVTASTIEEAAAMSLGSVGGIDVEFMNERLGRSATDVELAAVAFVDPLTETYIPRASYLSGNVREKLHQARHGADHNVAYLANVRALEEVVPSDIDPADLRARIGVGWVTGEEMEAFTQETFGDGVRLNAKFTPGVGWVVDANRNYGNAALRESLHTTWGTEAMSGLDLIKAAMEGRPIKLRLPKDAGGGVDVNRTLEAVEKLEELHRAFQQWVVDSPAERRDRMLGRYNERFRSWVPATYSGEWIDPPQLTEGFELRPHQRRAVERALLDGRVFLGHVVGAGKTAVMATAAVEGKRLGLHERAMLLVPNHLVDQTSAEILRLYPAAKVLTPSDKETKPERRREFATRIATGDWDAIVMSYETFLRLPVSPEDEARFIDQRVDELTMALGSVSSGTARTKKNLEKQIARLEERVKELRDTPADATILRWDELGVDMLMVDEVHNFKNLATPSNNEELSESGSKRASDLLLKLEIMRRGSHEGNGRAGVVLASGTPVANRVAEMYVMQKFLQPDVLKTADVEGFDTWAASFGRVVSKMELNTTGTTYQMKSRFAGYQNVGDLMRMALAHFDFVMSDDLDLPRPLVRGGGARIVEVPESAAMAELMAELVERSQRLSSDSADVDNILKIIGDGTKGALDLRMVGRIQPMPSKLSLAADQIVRIHNDHADMVFYGDDANPEPRPGALQVVFCDLGVPGGSSGFDAYAELREMIVAQGVARHQVAFIHDARNDEQKAQLFGRCLDGQIRVLIGSTGKMGTGTNVQKRLAALHHLDAPWRPADIEQREGRILRQGNQHAEVEILRYVTTKSMDALRWQALVRKQRFIAQLLEARTGDVIEVDEIENDAEAGFAAVQAAATGDPNLVKKAEIDMEISRLDRLSRQARSAAQRQESRLATFRTQIVDLGRRVDIARGLVERIDSTQGYVPAGTRRDLAESMSVATKDELCWVELNHLTNPARQRGRAYIGDVRGLSLVAEKIGQEYLVVSIAEQALAERPARRPPSADDLADSPSMRIDIEDLRKDGCSTRLLRLTTQLKAQLGRLESQLDTATDGATQIEKEPVKPFEGEGELAKLRTQSRALEQLILDAAEKRDSPGTDQEQPGVGAADDFEVGL